MLKRAMLALLLLSTALPLTGCVVEAGRPYPAAVWVPGHFGPYGGWHPGYWR